MDRKDFPGQVERAEFDLAQVESLASPVRGEVFWAFAKEHPLSVAEVAAGLGKSAQTVHYHVNELVRIGLLIAVDTRRQGARTEKLFVHSAKVFVGRGAAAPREYRDHAVRGFQAITRTMARENEALHRAIDVDPSISDFGLYWRETVRLTPERAVELKKKLRAAISEALEYDAGEDGTRVTVSVYMAPTLQESRRWRARFAGEEPPAENEENE
jgi:DNA-binding Lrp family transcriptional regulator